MLVQLQIVSESSVYECRNETIPGSIGPNRHHYSQGRLLPTASHGHPPSVVCVTHCLASLWLGGRHQGERALCDSRWRQWPSLILYPFLICLHEVHGARDVGTNPHSRAQ